MYLCGHFPQETSDALEAIVKENTATMTIPPAVLQKAAKQFSRFLVAAFEDPERISTNEELRERFTNAEHTLLGTLHSKVDPSQFMVLRNLFKEVVDRLRISVTMGPQLEEHDVADTRDVSPKPRARADADQKWQSRKFSVEHVAWINSDNAALHKAFFIQNWSVSAGPVEMPSVDRLQQIAAAYTVRMQEILAPRNPPTYQTFFKQMQELEQAMSGSLMQGAEALSAEQALAVVGICQRFRTGLIENHLKASADLRSRGL